jgi:hypothetical protein
MSRSKKEPGVLVMKGVLCWLPEFCTCLTVLICLSVCLPENYRGLVSLPLSEILLHPGG